MPLAISLSPADLAELVRLYEAGGSCREVARAFGLSASKVRKTLIESGVKLRTTSESKRLNVEGQTFGRLTAIKRLAVQPGNETLYEWKCKCGNIFVDSARAIKSGSKLSCGCLAADKTKERNRARARPLPPSGRLRPLRDLGKGRWLFTCDCGRHFEAAAHNVRSGSTQSCGCLRRESLVNRGLRQRLDLSGQSFGLLTAENVVRSDKHKKIIWLFRCKCGKKTEAAASAVKRGAIKSCGCLSRGVDSIASILEGSFRNAQARTNLYVYRLKRFSAYLKIGIDATGERAKRDDEYGELLFSLELSRVEAWILEQAVLFATLDLKACPWPLRRSKWIGQTEVRRSTPFYLEEAIRRLHDELRSIGLWRFAIRRIPMTRQQVRECECRSRSVTHLAIHPSSAEDAPGPPSL